jgi:hypothetical protein
MTLGETLISVWQQSLANGQEEVGLGQESYPVTVFRKKLRRRRVQLRRSAHHRH